MALTAVAVVAAVMDLLMLAAAPIAIASPTTTRVSVSSSGSEAIRGGDGVPWMSADGRFVLFSSRSPRLVPGDGSDWDAFVRDRLRQKTTLATVHDGIPGGFDGNITFSLSGRYVGFDLHIAQPDVPPFFGRRDAYIRDMRTRTTTPLLPSGADQRGLDSSAPAVSRNGRFAAFVSLRVPGARPNRGFNVLVRDRRRGTTRLVSRARDGGPANGASIGQSISADGRYIAFSSTSSDIVRHDGNGRHSDVFVYDRAARRIVWTTATAAVEYIGTRRRIAGADFVAISASGRYVAFSSTSSRLVEGDTNRQSDIFIRDLRTRTTQRVSVATGGRQVCVPPPRDWQRPCNMQFGLSPDGRYVAFTSTAPDLVPDDRNQMRDVFLHDARTLVTTRASVNASGGEICGPFSDGCAWGASVSAGGRYVGFTSTDDAVVPNDRNRAADVFVRGPLP